MRIAVLLTFLAALPLAAQDKPVKKAELGPLKARIAAWFAAPAAKRGKLLDELAKAGIDALALSKKDAQWLESVALAGNPTLKGRKGDYGLDVDAAGRKAWVHVHVPPNYSPKTPVPLVVSLHGGSAETTTYEGSKKAGSTQIMGWTSACDAAGALLVAPSTTGFWSDASGMASITKAINHARETYTIDPNRVIITGHSMGGFGIFDFAPDIADRFALAAPFVGGAEAGHKLKNCRNLPFYIVIGANDKMEYINVACRKNAKALEELAYDVTFKERKDKGHDLIEDEFPAVLAKAAKSPRNLHAKKITRASGSGRWYWLEADGSIDAEIKGSTIEISGPSSATVFLSDRMVDLDKPVIIKLDGETKFEGKVERTAGHLLRHVAETDDPGRLYTARVVIE